MGPRAPNAGFSLIELLVAVLVVVLLTTVVTLNVGSGGRDIELADEVRYLADALGYAQSEAEMAGADYGLLIERQGLGANAQYVGQWRRRYDQGWAPVQGVNSAIPDVDFCPACDLVLMLDGQPEVSLEVDDDITNPLPQVQIFAGGEMTPGALEWLDRRTGELLWRLQWDLFGRMTVMPRGLPPNEST